MSERERESARESHFGKSRDSFTRFVTTTGCKATFLLRFNKVILFNFYSVVFILCTILTESGFFPRSDSLNRSFGANGRCDLNVTFRLIPP